MSHGGRSRSSVRSADPRTKWRSLGLDPEEVGGERRLPWTSPFPSFLPHETLQAYLSRGNPAARPGLPKQGLRGLEEDETYLWLC